MFNVYILTSGTVQDLFFLSNWLSVRKYIAAKTTENYRLHRLMLPRPLQRKVKQMTLLLNVNWPFQTQKKLKKPTTHYKIVIKGGQTPFVCLFLIKSLWSWNPLLPQGNLLLSLYLGDGGTARPILMPLPEASFLSLHTRITPQTTAENSPAC